MEDATLTDISKMKVIDLRKELKSRGLSSTGDKADLVARLQSVLSSDVKDSSDDQEPLTWDDIDSDGVLDEDEKTDNDLLEDAVVSINEELALAKHPPPAEQPPPAQSVAPKPGGDKPQRTLKRKITMSEPAKDTKSSDGKTTDETAAKKIVLNRSTSVKSMINTPTAINTEDHSPEESIKTEDFSINSVKPKILANLDSKTRLELRAKRFGLPVKMSDTERKEARKQRFGHNTGLSGDIDANLDKLTKRAERFGQSVSKITVTVKS